MPTDPEQPVQLPYFSELWPYQQGRFEDIGFTHRMSVVMPVIVRYPDRVICVGTAFSVGGGIFITAAHVVLEVIELARDDPNCSMAIIYIGNNSGRWPAETTRVLNVWSMSTAGHHDLAVLQVVPPSPVNGVELYFRRFTLSPGIPSIGTATRAHGYSRFSVEFEPKDDLYEVLNINFRYNISDGPVNSVVPHGQGSLNSRMYSYPGMFIGARHDPGMSGGPIFDGTTGSVIGVVSIGGGQDDNGTYHAFASLLAPALGLTVEAPPDSSGNPVEMPLIDVAAQGVIKVDTTVGSLQIDHVEGRMEVSYPRTDGQPAYHAIKRALDETNPLLDGV